MSVDIKLQKNTLYCIMSNKAIDLFFSLSSFTIFGAAVKVLRFSDGPNKFGSL